MNNSQVIKAFMTHLNEFMEDMLHVYPDNKAPYDDVLEIIDETTMDKILNKNFNKELNMAKDHMDVKDAGALFERMKDLLKIVKDENVGNSIKALTYVRNLCKISKLYN